MHFLALALLTVSADPTTDTPTPPPAASAIAPAAAEATPWTPDHDISKRRVALWAGGQNTLSVGDLTIGSVNPADAPTQGSVSFKPFSTTAWFVGMRYWLKSFETFDVGIDAGIAVTGVSARVQETVSPGGGQPTQLSDVTPPIPSTVFVHLGAPMSVYNGHHYALIVVPQVDVGYAYATVTRAADLLNNANAGVKAVVSGAFVQVGVRAGPEISFGYFDIPELVIHPSVGFLLNYQSFSSSLTQAGYTVSQESAFDVANTSVVGSNLAGSIDVLYYF